VQNITVNLHKPHKQSLVTFKAELVCASEGYALVRALWGRPTLDLGYVTFESDDQFLEHYYADRWYAVFEIRSASGRLKGWYCNISRPAAITPDAISSDDLDLDLFVAPERTTLLRLDEDEFESRGLREHDPAAYLAAYAALDELERLARAGAAPFDSAAG
jgi:predicted RNA-binding protein associated with RNAse of E/G family